MEPRDGRARTRPRIVAALSSALCLLLPRAAAADVRLPLSWVTGPLLPVIVLIETAVLSMVLRRWRRPLWERVFIVTAANVLTSFLSSFFSLYKFHLENAAVLGKALLISVVCEWLVYVAYYALKRVPIGAGWLMLASLLANLATYGVPIAGYLIEPQPFPFDDARAASRLYEIASAEIVFRSKGLIDEDRDGVGEFGFLRELTGEDTSRMTKPYPSSWPRILDWPNSPAPRGWGPVSDGDGIRHHYGYYFVCYLPTGSGYVRERDIVPSFDARDTNGMEARRRRFLVYAWPISYAVTARRAWAVDASGARVWTSNGRQKYSGLDRIPPATAALDDAGRLDGESHFDGGDWQVLR